MAFLGYSNLYIADEVMTPKERLAVRLLISRKAAKLTQGQIAIRLGLKQQTIADYEKYGNIQGWMLSDWAKITDQQLEFFRCN